jgi:hypothetical protein
LQIQPFCLGRLVGAEGNSDVPEQNPHESGEDTMISALEHLIEQQRPVVHRALVNAYGSAEKLYFSMYRVAEECEPDDTDAWEVTGPNSDALSFVQNAFQRA